MMETFLLRFLLCLVLVLGSKEICENDFKDMVNGEYKDGYLMISYSGKDINDLGLYRDCIELSNARYYLMVSDIKDATISMGICTPKSCSDADLEALSHELYVYYQNTELSKILENPKFEESFKFNNREMPASAFYFIIFLIFYVTVVGISTYLEYLNEKFPNNEQLKNFEMIFAFSLISNYRKLIYVSKDVKNSHVLNGVKVLSMLLICLAHSYVYVAAGPVKNLAYTVNRVRKNFIYRPVYSGIYSVDAFFFIAGFLLAYFCIKQLHSSSGKMNWALFFIHRLLRIIPLFYFLNYFYIFLFPYTGFGPGWYLYHHSSNSACSDYWWSNFIFLNNFLPTSEYSCMPWTWYISCDMQFYFLTPLLLLLQYHRKNYGYIFCGLLVVTNFICIIVQASLNDYLPGASGGLMNKEQFTGVYIKPYDRMGAYILGMMLGYLIEDIERIKKVPKPQEDIELGLINTNDMNLKPLLISNRGSIESKISKCVKVFKNRLISMVTGIILILLMICVPYNYDNHGGDYWPKGVRVLFVAIEHIGFSIGFGLFLFPMLMGYGGMLKNFLSCSFFALGSKLSLGFYMVHPIYLVYISMNNSEGIYFENVYVLFIMFGVLILSIVTAALLYLIVESPISRLESLITKRLRS